VRARVNRNEFQGMARHEEEVGKTSGDARCGYERCAGVCLAESLVERLVRVEDNLRLNIIRRMTTVMFHALTPNRPTIKSLCLYEA
jgi:hypothetical protein